MGMHSLPVNAQSISPEDEYMAQREAQQNKRRRPSLKMPQSIVVCRAKQCAPARLSMAKEYIFNTLLHMFDSNAREKALVCQGNANTHACIEEFITVPITVGVTPAYMYIDDVKIADVSISQRNTMALNLLLNWGVSYNGQTPVCRPSKNLLYVKNVNNVIMEDNGYTCKMTTIGSTTVSTMFAIDYIDLDYGYIGGYYSIGLSGPAFGGGSGYMILRLPKDISIEAKDFEVQPKEPKIEEKVEEFIEEIPVEQPQSTAEPETPAEPILSQPQEVVEPQPEVKPEPVHLTAPAMQNGFNTHGQYLYDSNTGQYVPLKALENGASAPQGIIPSAPLKAAPAALPEQQVLAQPVTQAVPVVQQVQPAPVMPQYDMSAEPFQYAATARRSYGTSSTMPTDNELVSEMLAQSQMQPVPMQTMMPPAGQTMLPQNMVPVYGQYFYDASSGQYVPANMVSANQVLFNPYAQQQPAQPAQTAVREPQAPNVSTIIKYNHPAQEYEKAKAEAAAEAERQRKVEKKKQEFEAQAVDFGGVKVFPLPSSNADRTTVAPTLKNSLSEYNNAPSRRYE